jgi:hypothetical protein
MLEEHLNRIYFTVLQNSIQLGYTKEEKQTLQGMLRDVLRGIVILFSPLLVEPFSKLLYTTKKQVD